MTKQERKQHRREQKKLRTMQWRQSKLERRADRIQGKTARPMKTVDEVFVSNGKKFHHTWCDAMNGIWLDGSTSIRVVGRLEALATGLGRCGLCEAKVHFEMR